MPKGQIYYSCEINVTFYIKFSAHIIKDLPSPLKVEKHITFTNKKSLII